MTDRATAMAAAAVGWHVFPLRRGDKRPAVRDWESRATTDPARIARCWAAGDYNVGIATGPSGLVVVDLDMPKQATIDGNTNEATGATNLAALATDHGQAIPDTYTVATASGGRHLYFTHPDSGPALRNTASKLAPLVDTRAHGGYVVAAGSRTHAGAYTTITDAPLAVLPGWLVQLASPAPVPAQEPVAVSLPDTRRGAYLNAAITAESDKVRSAAEGTRNAVLYTSAVALGQLVAGGELTEADVHTILSQAAAEAGLWLGESARTIASGLRAGAARPRSFATAS